MINKKTSIIMPITLIIMSLIVSYSFKSAFDRINCVRVTGSAKTDFVADIIVWSSTFSTKNMDLQEAYKDLDSDRAIIKKYLKKNNIPLSDVIFSSINIIKDYDNKRDKDGITTQEFVGFLLSQDIKIESSAVEEIEGLSRDITSLIDKGIEIQSTSPYYFYSKLADLKLDMISKASKDAKERADRIAQSAGSKLGTLLDAQMGVFQITAKNSTERYSWGGTHNKTSKNKTATVTMKLSYGLGS